MGRKRTLLRSAAEIFKSIVFSSIISAIAVFSLSFFLNYSIGKVVIQATCLIIFGSMIYSAMWFEGDKDKNFVQFGRIQEDKLWGVKAGCIAMFLPILSSLFLVASKLQITPDLTIIYKLFNMHFNVIVSYFIPLAVIKETGWLEILGVTLLQLSIPVFSGIGYILGYKRISVMEKLIYKDKGKPKSKRAKEREDRLRR